MTKELPWFKFTPDRWLTGDIAFEPLEVQGAFMMACAHYWSRGCHMTVEDYGKRMANAWQSHSNRISIASESHSDRIRIALSKYVIEEGDMVRIPFLDEQFEELGGKREKRSNAGKAGAAARWAKGKQGDGNANGKRIANAMRSQCDGNGNKEVRSKKEEGRYNPPNPPRGKFGSKEFADALKKMGADASHVADFMAARKKKRAANTETALNRFVSQCEKASVPVADAVRIAAGRSWAGFYDTIADEYHGEKGGRKTDVIPGI